MLSRVADSLYWMSRYLERAENTVRQLDALGVPVIGRPFRGISYVSARHEVPAPFRSGTGLGVRRTALHAALADAAVAAGVTIVTATVGAITQSSDSVRAAGWQARYLAAAVTKPSGGP